MPADRSDAELRALLHSAREGDGIALEALLRELYPSIRTYAYRRVQARRDAEAVADDIAQEALLRVVHGIGSCRAGSLSSLFSWAIVVTHRVMIDLMRNDKAREAWVRSTPYLQEADERASARAWLTEPSSTSAATALLADIVNCVLCSLPETTTAILHLRTQLRLSWPEVAAEARTTATAAKRRFQRAQRRIQRDLLAQVLQLPAQQQQTISRRLRQMGVSLPIASGRDDPL